MFGCPLPVRCPRIHTHGLAPCCSLDTVTASPDLCSLHQGPHAQPERTAHPAAQRPLRVCWARCGGCTLGVSLGVTLLLLGKHTGVKDRRVPARHLASRLGTWSPGWEEVGTPTQKPGCAPDTWETRTVTPCRSLALQTSKGTGSVTLARSPGSGCGVCVHSCRPHPGQGLCQEAPTAISAHAPLTVTLLAAEVTGGTQPVTRVSHRQSASLRENEVRGKAAPRPTAGALASRTN